MLFLQIPAADDIADELSHTFDGVQSEWTHFWSMLLDSPLEALKFLGTSALGVATRVAIALLVIWAARLLVRKIRRLMDTIFDRRKVDSSVRIFFGYLVSIFLYIFVIVIVIGILGWNMTGLVAVFAAAAFAVGMALSGTLSNFAGGILILLLKPFRIGDYIEAQGFGGTVRSIELFHTTVTTSDNKTIIMPNGPLSTGIVDNVSRQQMRMVEWKVGISYGDDFATAESTVRDIFAGDPRILAEPAVRVVINELNSSAVVLLIRAWVASDDYWDVFWDVNRALYTRLPASGVQFPSTQIDVKIKQ